jgi:YegS/Rv2252/BmrU family lipid kinase
VIPEEMTAMTRFADEERIQIGRGDRLLVVANPATRRDIRAVIAALRDAAPDGVEIDVRITTRAGEARELAASHAEGARLIVAVGGDGTVAEVASAVVHKEIPLAILPGGSTNIIARELRIPTRVADGAALIFGPHRVRRIDAGWSERRIFLHMAGAGFDSRLFARSNSAWKRRVGWLAYLPAAVRALLDRPSTMRITVDGTEHLAKSPLVLVANGKSIVHPAMKLARGISKADGLLDVFIVTANGPVQLAKVLVQAATRRLDRSPYVDRLRGVEIALDAEPHLPVQFDGDVDGETPVALRVLPGAIRVIVPEIPEKHHPAVF